MAEGNTPSDQDALQQEEQEGRYLPSSIGTRRALTRKRNEIFKFANHLDALNSDALRSMEEIRLKELVADIECDIRSLQAREATYKAKCEEWIKNIDSLEDEQEKTAQQKDMNAYLQDTKDELRSPLSISDMVAAVIEDAHNFILRITKQQEIISESSSRTSSRSHSVKSPSPIGDLPQCRSSQANRNNDCSPVGRGPIIAPTVIQPVSVPQFPTAQCELKLPMMKLPIFEGDSWKFKDFWSSFEELVHKSGYSNLVKFTYLRNCLEGKAKEVIETIEFSNDSYLDAVNELHRQFGDETLRMEDLYSKINELKYQRSLEHQQKVLRQIRGYLLQLKGLGDQHDNPALNTVILTKFGRSIQEEVEKLRIEKEYKLSQKDMLEKLEQIIKRQLILEKRFPRINNSFPMHCSLPEDVSDGHRGKKGKNKQRNGKNKSQSNKDTRVPENNSADKKQANTSPSKSNQPRAQLNKPVQNQFTENVQQNCPLCEKGVHRAENCRSISDIQKRREKVMEKGLCYACLQFGHGSKQCSRRCPTCQSQHHQALCAEHQRRFPPFNSQNRYFQSSVPQNTASKNNQMFSAPPRMEFSRPPPARPQGSEANQGQVQAIPMNFQVPIISQLNHKNNSKTTAQFKGRLLTTEAVASHKGIDRKVEIFLDTGCAISVVTEELKSTLQLPIKCHKAMKLVGISGVSNGRKNYEIVELSLYKLDGTLLTFEAAVAASPLAGTIPAIAIPPPDQQFLKERNIQVSNMDRCTPYCPDVIIGNNAIYKVLNFAQKSVQTPGGLVAIPTAFGHILGGQLEDHNITIACVASVEGEDENTPSAADKELNQKITKFLRLDAATDVESGPDKAMKAAELEQVNKQFRETIRFVDGSYHVSFFFKDNISSLAPNYHVAWNRLKILLKSLQKQPQLLEAYDAIFKKQLEADQIEVVEPGQQPEGPVYVIPHQGVIRPGHPTHPLRVVLDASSHAKGQISLNDTVHAGDTNLEEIPALLLRVRTKRFIWTCDVEKAFLQVKLNRECRDVTRFLWIKDTTKELTVENLVTYRYKSVPFGVDESPFLLKATILYALEKFLEELSTMEKTEQVILQEQVIHDIIHNTYVDNIVLGYEDHTKGLQIHQISKEIFARIGMNLREFAGPDVALMNNIPEKDRGKVGEQKLLGMVYDNVNDTIILKCSLTMPENKLTKRIVFSIAASTFDPLGLLVPLLLPLKIFMQSLWTKQYGWDTQLEQEDVEMWRKVLENAQPFKFSLPRHTQMDHTEQYLTVFCDASKDAAGAIVYLWNQNGAFPLIGKSQLAPKRKPITIPKFELRAIEIGVNLLKYAKNALCKGNPELKFHFRLFSDSAVALRWATSLNPPNTYAVNRTSKIAAVVEELKELWTPADNKDTVHTPTFTMAHVRSRDNPADHATRGLTAEEMSDPNHIWWKGPAWMKDNPEDWPTEIPHVAIEDGRFMRKEESAENEEDQLPAMPILPETKHKSILDANKFKDLNSLVKRMAYVLRVLAKIVPKKIKEKHPDYFPENAIPSVPNAKEREAALKMLIKDHQQRFLHIIKTNKNLRPVLCEDQLYRCTSGRMQHSALSPTAKKPILLVWHKDSRLVELIIEHEHKLQGHGGLQLTLNALRNKYWITNGKRAVNAVRSRCIVCKRENNKPFAHPDNPQLPPERVQIPAHPFQHIGLDYRGPFTTKLHKKDIKTYVLLLTCLSSRAVHLEVVTELTTARFLNAFTRFTSRRGVPDTIISDNAETFKLAESVLQEQWRQWEKDETLLSYMAEKGITWRYITAYAPWRGGVYERLVGSTKKAFRKMVGNRKLEYDDMHTIITGIEGILNTRPLTQLSSDFADSTEVPVVRPIDLLIPKVQLGLPVNQERQEEEDDEYLPGDVATKTRMTTIAHFEKTMFVLQQFWEVWRTSYLQELREVSYRNPPGKHPLQGGLKEPRVGDVVIMVDADTPRASWKLARLLEIKTSEHDNRIRTAIIRRPNGRVKERPINLLVPLEVADEFCPQPNDETSAPAEEETEIPMLPMIFGEWVDECLFCNGYGHTPEHCTVVDNVHIRCFIVVKQNKCSKCLESMDGHIDCGLICSYCSEPHHESLCQELALRLEAKRSREPTTQVEPRRYFLTNTTAPPEFIRIRNIVTEDPMWRMVKTIERPLAFTAKLWNPITNTTVDVDVLINSEPDNVINMELALDNNCQPVPEAAVPESDDNPRVLIYLIGTNGERIPVEAEMAPGFQMNFKVQPVPESVRTKAASLGYSIKDTGKTEFRAKLLIKEGWLPEIWPNTVYSDTWFFTTGEFPLRMNNNWSLIHTRIGTIFYAESDRDIMDRTSKVRIGVDEHLVRPLRRPMIDSLLLYEGTTTTIIFKTIPEYADLRMIVVSKTFAQQYSSRAEGNCIMPFVITTEAGKQIPMKVYVTSEEYLYTFFQTNVTQEDADFLEEKGILIEGRGKKNVQMAIPKCMWRQFVRDTSLRMPSGTQVWNTEFGYVAVSPETTDGFSVTPPKVSPINNAIVQQHEKGDQPSGSQANHGKRGNLTKFALMTSLMLSLLSTTQAAVTASCLQQGGLNVTIDNGTRAVEVCTTHSCHILTGHSEPQSYQVDFPPSVLLHQHESHIKFNDTNGNIEAFTIACPPQDFCSAIKCTLCWSILSNPECFPNHTLVILSLFLFLAVLLFSAVSLSLRVFVAIIATKTCVRGYPFRRWEYPVNQKRFNQ